MRNNRRNTTPQQRRQMNHLDRLARQEKIITRRKAREDAANLVKPEFV